MYRDTRAREMPSSTAAAEKLSDFTTLVKALIVISRSIGLLVVLVVAVTRVTRRTARGYWRPVDYCKGCNTCQRRARLQQPYAAGCRRRWPPAVRPRVARRTGPPSPLPATGSRGFQCPRFGDAQVMDVEDLIAVVGDHALRARPAARPTPAAGAPPARAPWVSPRPAGGSAPARHQLRVVDDADETAGRGGDDLLARQRRAPPLISSRAGLASSAPSI